MLGVWYIIIVISRVAKSAVGILISRLNPATLNFVEQMLNYGFWLAIVLFCLL